VILEKAAEEKWPQAKVLLAATLLSGVEVRVAISISHLIFRCLENNSPACQ